MPAAADPAEGFVFEVGCVAAEEGAQLTGVVLDVADAHQVQFAAGDFVPVEAGGAGEGTGLGADREVRGRIWSLMAGRAQRSRPTSSHAIPAASSRDRGG